jgi:hypothetical protein
MRSSSSLQSVRHETGRTRERSALTLYPDPVKRFFEDVGPGQKSHTVNNTPFLRGGLEDEAVREDHE